MALNEQDTSAGAQAHYAAAAVEIGQRLAERRTSRGQTLEEHMVPLRTTRHQLAALESGNTQVFYGRSYYEGLLARYATALGLNAEDLLVSLRPAPPAEEAPLPEPPPIDQPPASPPEPLADPPHLRRQRSALAVACAVAVLVIASAMLVWWDSEPSPAPMATTPETTPDATQAATQAATPPASPAATPETIPLATTPTAPAPAPAPAPTPASAPEAPALRLRAGNAATWYWVRKANDEVEQRSLSGGGSVAFDEMPIYLVVNGPDEVRVEVRGKEVRLKANDETGRNLARVGRIALEELAR